MRLLAALKFWKPQHDAVNAELVAADIVRLLALIGLGLAIAVVILVGRRLFWRERL